MITFHQASKLAVRKVFSIIILSIHIPIDWRCSMTHMELSKATTEDCALKIRQILVYFKYLCHEIVGISVVDRALSALSANFNCEWLYVSIGGFVCIGTLIAVNSQWAIITLSHGSLDAASEWKWKYAAYDLIWQKQDLARLQTRWGSHDALQRSSPLDDDIVIIQQVFMTCQQSYFYFSFSFHAAALSLEEKKGQNWTWRRSRFYFFEVECRRRRFIGD